jgi:hypothetical protein
MTQKMQERSASLITAAAIKLSLFKELSLPPARSTGQPWHKAGHDGENRQSVRFNEGLKMQAAFSIGL